MTYTAISLFSGAVDGLAIAAQAAGINVTHHVEWDAWCCRVLRMNHPDSIVLNKDIHDVHDLPPADIIFGGSPCQEFSVAGNGAGFSGERYLWPEMFRIVRTNKPRVVIHENVRGGVSKGLLDQISNDLESAGYETTALVFPACVFGAPHERYRMFHIGLLAHTNRQRRNESQPQQECSNDLNGFNSASERSRGTEFHATKSGGQDVEYAAKPGLYQPQQSNRRTDETQTVTGMDNRLERSSSAVEYGQIIRLETYDYESIGGSSRQHHIRPHGDWNYNGISQSSVGGAAHGLTSRLPRLNPVADFPGFPAGQGHYQYPYEPPRTTPKKGEYAKERIQALGNAVVWQQASPIMRTVVRWLEGQSNS